MKSQDWFAIDKIDKDTYAISEYRHPEETHCYLLIGTKRCLLIDTGLGIDNIYQQIQTITNKHITAIATHIHWDHIGGHAFFPDFYAHRLELPWLNGDFPISISAVRNMISQSCDLPSFFDIDKYTIFKGTPSVILDGGETIDLGNRTIIVIHTPGHSPGHMCFWESERGYLFTGDLVYKGTLYANFPSTSPVDYLTSIESISALPIRKIFPAHHSLDISPKIINEIHNALQTLSKQNTLKHGAGIFNYNDWSILL